MGYKYGIDKTAADDYYSMLNSTGSLPNRDAGYVMTQAKPNQAKEADLIHRAVQGTRLFADHFINPLKRGLSHFRNIAGSFLHAAKGTADAFLNTAAAPANLVGAANDWIARKMYGMKESPLYKVDLGNVTPNAGVKEQVNTLSAAGLPSDMAYSLNYGVNMSQEGNQARPMLLSWGLGKKHMNRFGDITTGATKQLADKGTQMVGANKAVAGVAPVALLTTGVYLWPNLTGAVYTDPLVQKGIAAGVANVGTHFGEKAANFLTRMNKALVSANNDSFTVGGTGLAYLNGNIDSVGPTVLNK